MSVVLEEGWEIFVVVGVGFKLGESCIVSV